ncbi:hypothetical protein T492DRAFT_873636 [Pavlovales sp. CCMP2436]|nr:hypothetical protein T492DRAFT_873636 [Pavlovales sp. CCMP2436]
MEQRKPTPAFTLETGPVGGGTPGRRAPAMASSCQTALAPFAGSLVPVGARPPVHPEVSGARPWTTVRLTLAELLPPHPNISYPSAHAVLNAPRSRRRRLGTTSALAYASSGPAVSQGRSPGGAALPPAQAQIAGSALLLAQPGDVTRQHKLPSLTVRAGCRLPGVVSEPVTPSGDEQPSVLSRLGGDAAQPWRAPRSLVSTLPPEWSTAPLGLPSCDLPPASLLAAEQYRRGLAEASLIPRRAMPRILSTGLPPGWHPAPQRHEPGDSSSGSGNGGRAYSGQRQRRSSDAEPLSLRLSSVPDLAATPGAERSARRYEAWTPPADEAAGPAFSTPATTSKEQSGPASASLRTSSPVRLLSFGAPGTPSRSFGTLRPSQAQAAEQPRDLFPRPRRARSAALSPPAAAADDVRALPSAAARVKTVAPSPRANSVLLAAREGRRLSGEQAPLRRLRASRTAADLAQPTPSAAHAEPARTPASARAAASHALASTIPSRMQSAGAGSAARSSPATMDTPPPRARPAEKKAEQVNPSPLPARRLGAGGGFAVEAGSAEAAKPKTALARKRPAGKQQPRLFSARIKASQSASGAPLADGFEWLMQKGFELMLMIRAKLDSRELSATVDHLGRFVSDLSEAAGRASVEKAHIVQELLLRLLGVQQSFDSQRGTAAIPMHQAKVLDRSSRLQALNLEAVLGERMESMVSAMGKLRTLLKIKVEDGNDLVMAEGTIAELGAFFGKLREVAAQKQLDEFELFVSLRS